MAADNPGAVQYAPTGCLKKPCRTPRNTMMGIATLFGNPLPAVRMACAENRCATIATVKNGFL
jgi:hypothetical protein